MDKYLHLEDWSCIGVWSWSEGIFEDYFIWFFDNISLFWILTNSNTNLRVESSTFTAIDSILEELWQKHQSKSEVEA